MNNDTRINEILGAKIFKPWVFKLEDIKFKIIERFFPTSEELYERRLRQALDLKLKRAKSKEEKESYIRDYQEKILISRKEFNMKKNRNYHIDMDNPNEFVRYLEINKKIHKNGLIKNFVVFLGSAAMIICGSQVIITIGVVTLVFNSISAFINFECVNLQNYNLKRFRKAQERFERLKEKRLEKDLKKYGEISKIVSGEMKRSIDIPTEEEIIDAIETKEQLEQLKELLLRHINTNNIDGVIKLEMSNTRKKE